MAATNKQSVAFSLSRAQVDAERLNYFQRRHTALSHGLIEHLLNDSPSMIIDSFNNASVTPDRLVFYAKGIQKAPSNKLKQALGDTFHEFTYNPNAKTGTLKICVDYQPVDQSYPVAPSHRSSLCGILLRFILYCSLLLVLLRYLYSFVDETWPWLTQPSWIEALLGSSSLRFSA